MLRKKIDKASFISYGPFRSFVSSKNDSHCSLFLAWLDLSSCVQGKLNTKVLIHKEISFLIIWFPPIFNQAANS
jgi:hypothetical protein